VRGKPAVYRQRGADYEACCRTAQPQHGGGAFITGSDFLIDGGTTAVHWYG
jgi:hypothetical protein